MFTNAPGHLQLQLMTNRIRSTDLLRHLSVSLLNRYIY
jgi:hypothetical protein